MLYLKFGVCYVVEEIVSFFFKLVPKILAHSLFNLKFVVFVKEHLSINNIVYTPIYKN